LGIEEKEAKMKQELKQKWVAALRSGKYRQGRGHLRVVNLDGSITFCCLGVLHMVVEGELPPNDFGYLSCSTEEKANISRENQLALATLNDDGKTFLEIADVIEQREI